MRRAFRQPGLGQARVSAAAATLLETAAIRVGNDEYTQQNGTYGVTTLRSRHVKVDGPLIELQFVAKGGQKEAVVVKDRQAASVIEECKRVPGREVFKWFDSEWKKHDLKSRHVNDFIRAASGGDFTAKDLRTWVGTLRAYRYLLDKGPPGPDTDAESVCLAAVDSVAEFLRDTREVARSAYIHQGVLDAFCDGTLHELRAQLRSANRSLLSDDERGLVQLLRHLQRRGATT
jgi:DNA topoisomerase-1